MEEATIGAGIERYRDVVDDWEAFRAASGRPEPVTLRVRTGRVTTSALRARLEGQGFRLEALGTPADVLRVNEAPFPVSRTLEHWLGLFYIQQAVTALAAPALAPRPGERVLDLCAAPGGKTTHLADLMDDRGAVVAADRSERRLRALLGNVYRTAHTSVTVVAADARRFPDGVAFDRVLVDVPCSGEGNLRANGGHIVERKASFAEHILGMQRALLRRAVALTRPGGVILYVTCTFAPEENEAVVDRILRELPVRLEPIPLSGPHAPGLTSFGGRDYHSDLRLAWRLYPHHLDSGGLFMARLRKEGDAPPDGAREGGASAPELDVAVAPGDATPPSEARARVRATLETFLPAFGVAPATFAGVRWTVRGDSVWMGRVAEGVPDAWPAAPGWRLVSTGLRAFKEDPRSRSGARPTNDLLQWLDNRVGDRVVELDEEGARRVLAREPVLAHLTDGFAALRFDGRVVGRGRVREGRLSHEIPKAHARALGEALDARAAGVGW